MMFLGVLKLVPRWVWLLLAGALLFRLTIGMWHAHERKLVQSGYDQRVAEDKERGQQFQKDDQEVGHKAEIKYVTQTRVIHDRANALRLRSPGKIVVHVPGDKPASDADGAGAPDVGLGLANVQIEWNELVDHAENSDRKTAKINALQEYIRGIQAAMLKESETHMSK